MADLLEIKISSKGRQRKECHSNKPTSSLHIR